VTAQGHPRVIFQRAIERGNLPSPRRLSGPRSPRPTLVDLLDLTALIAFKRPERHARVAARWLLRYLEAVEDATIEDAAYVASCLQALGGRHHEHALAALRGVAEEATTRGRGRGVA
jgi:hypothetical protein